MGDLMIRDFYLPDATLSVVRDPIAKENRMMLLSHCTSIGVCMKCEASALEINLSRHSQNIQCRHPSTPRPKIIAVIYSTSIPPIL